MALTLEETEHIANLARLELSQEEKDKFREQLSIILDHAARLQAIETSNIPATSTVLPPNSALRADEPCQGLTTEQVLLNAADTQDGQFRVPPVLT